MTSQAPEAADIAEFKPIEIAVGETQPVEAQPVEAPAVEAELAEAKPAEAEPTDVEAEEYAAPETPPLLGAAPRRRTLNWSVTSVTAISFSLTFVLMSIALVVGLLPPDMASLTMPVDLGVLLLIVPLSALVLAIMAEALRIVVRGVPVHRAPRTVTALSDWRPGRGEG
jgi:hypothetical protein